MDYNSVEDIMGLFAFI